MDISNSDLTLLAFLESIEASPEIPDGCDVEKIVSQGLVTCHANRWALTPAGQDRLRHLRAVLRGDHRAHG